MRKRITAANYFNEQPNDVIKTCRITPKEYEAGLRKHLHGANQQQMRAEYEKVYRKNRSDR
jgi:hypothetical protein